MALVGQKSTWGGARIQDRCVPGVGEIRFWQPTGSGGGRRRRSRWGGTLVRSKTGAVMIVGGSASGTTRDFVKFPETLARSIGFCGRYGRTYIARKEQANIKKPSVVQWLAGAGPLSPHGEGAMFDSRHGGAFSTPSRRGGVFVFRPACFCFVALGVSIS